MNTEAAPDEAPSRALALAAMGEPRVPGEGNYKRSAVLQDDAKLILSHLNVDGSRALALTR
jgi:hypothetical protein